MAICSTPHLRLALLFACASAGIAQTDHVTAFTGTWKLNLAKSTFKAGTAPQDVTLRITPDGTSSFSGTMHDGQLITYSFPWSSGKEVPVGGSLATMLRNPTATQTFQGKTCDIVLKAAGKVVLKIHATVSADGRTQTGIVTSFDETGQQIQNEEVYDKQ